MERASLTALTKDRGPRLGCSWLVCLGLLPALTAVAEPQAKWTDCQSSAECSQHLTQGISDYQQRHYPAAIPSFEKAYALSRDPRLLVLMGRTRFKLGDTAAALDYYSRARTQLTGAADRAKLEQYLAEARGEPGASPARPTAPQNTATATATAIAEPPARADAASAPGSTAPISQLDLRDGAGSPPAATPQEGKKVKPWVWAVIGVTAAAVVATGVGLGVYYGTGTPTPDATVRFP